MCQVRGLINNEYLVAAQTHYDFLLSSKKKFTQKYRIDEKDERLSSMNEFESNPTIYDSTDNANLKNYETILFEFICACDKDLIDSIANQFKTKDGYNWVSEYLADGSVKQSLYWKKISEYWEERERKEKIDREKEMNRRQKLRQEQAIKDEKEIQQYVDNNYDEPQFKEMYSLLNWWKAYLYM